MLETGHNFKKRTVWDQSFIEQEPQPDSHVTLAPSAGNRWKLQGKIQTALLEFSLTLVLHYLQKTEQRGTHMDVACKKYKERNQ